MPGSILKLLLYTPKTCPFRLLPTARDVLHQPPPPHPPSTRATTSGCRTWTPIFASPAPGSLLSPPSPSPTHGGHHASLGPGCGGSGPFCRALGELKIKIKERPSIETQTRASLPPSVHTSHAPSQGTLVHLLTDSMINLGAGRIGHGFGITNHTHTTFLHSSIHYLLFPPSFAVSFPPPHWWLRL